MLFVLIILIDPKTIKEELAKALEKDESDEKLAKLVRSIIVNLKNSLIASAGGANSLAKQQQNQQPAQQGSLTNENVNYLISLTYVAQHRPHLFVKQQSALLDVIFVVKLIILHSLWKVFEFWVCEESGFIIKVWNQGLVNAFLNY